MDYQQVEFVGELDQVNELDHSAIVSHLFASTLLLADCCLLFLVVLVIAVVVVDVVTDMSRLRSLADMTAD